MALIESPVISASPAPLEAWPLVADAPWRVIAWPNWGGDRDLLRIFGEFGTVLAEKGACLCLRHDPATDGAVENARARVYRAAQRTGQAELHPRIAIIDGTLSEADWEQIGALIDAKIPSVTWSKPARTARIDSLRAFELRTRADAERLLANDRKITPLDRYRRLFADVPGWFRLPAITLWDSLLTLQSESKVRGNFLEIGVWMGRSALLSTLHASDGEDCVFVDLLPTEEAESSLRSVRDSGLHFFQASSRDLVPAMLPGSSVPGYRWIHIDGEHSGIAVEHDLTLASSLLAKRGIIAVDDFFDHSYPQITFAVIEHLRAHPKSLTMFLCGFSKAYLCHPADARWLLRYVAEQLARDLVDRGAPAFTIYKTADPIDLNCFGIGSRTESTQFRGPDWNTELLQY